MAHDLKTRTIDYREDAPPEWATPEEKINFWPKRTARFICDEAERVEAEMAKKEAEQNAKEHKTANAKATPVGKEGQCV